MSRPFFFIIFVIFVLILSSCYRIEIPIPPTSSVSLPSSNESSPTFEQTLLPTITTTPTFYTTPLNQSDNHKKADVIRIYYEGSFNGGAMQRLRWSPDSQTLYFELVDRVNEYKITDNGIEKRTLQTIPIVSPTPQIIANLPANAFQVSISPKGDKVLFLTPAENMENIIETPTPTSELQDGEVFKVVKADLWLLDETQLHRLGELNNCVDEYFWSVDETRIIISALTPPAICETSAWMVDSNNYTIIDLLPKDKYSHSFSIYSVSPDASELLYNYQGKTILLDLDKMQFTELEFGPFIFSRWLNRDQILVAYDDKQQNSWVVSIVNLSSMMEENLIVLKDIPYLEGRRINELRVSGDGTKIAIAVGKDLWTIESVWVILRFSGN